jgi:antitoxin YefM
MKTVTVTDARKNLFGLVDETNQSSVQIQIKGKRGDAVLISSTDWESIQETLYLLSIPNMRESILAGIKTPIDECSTNLSW